MLTPLTHPDALDIARPTGSFWEASTPPPGFEAVPVEGDVACDVAIVGAGYTGLSAALRLREAHGADVRVLDAAAPGWGASGRNGGFCCLGGAKLDWAPMIARHGLAEARRLFEVQQDSVALVRTFCQERGIDAWISGEGELSLAHKPARLRDLEAERTFLKETFGHETTLLGPEALRQQGTHAPGLHGGLWNPVGFGLHPLRYLRGLAAAAVEQGAVLHGQSRVVAWEQRPGRHRLMTERGSVTAPKVVFATNGYTPEALVAPLRGRLLPVLSNILVTRPLTETERGTQGWTAATMAYDTRNLLHYFRLLPDGRFLFGGRGGTDGADAASAVAERRLRRSFEALFPAWRGVEHSHFWRGLACLSSNLTPYLGALDDARTVWTALAYHGNGVAMASWSGRALADHLADSTKRPALPGFMTRLPRPFPLPALRGLYLRSAYLCFEAQDRWL